MLLFEKECTEVGGYITVGFTDRREIVVDLEHNTNGKLILSPEQAVKLSHLILKKVTEEDDRRNAKNKTDQGTSVERPRD